MPGDPRPQAAEQICRTGRLLASRGFLAATEGNLSSRISDREVLCTPTLAATGELEPDDLCIVDLAGNPVAGQRQPTSEIRLHLAIYSTSPQTRAVVHCHPPHATAFAVSRQPLPAGLLAEAEYFLGQVPTIEYRTPGSEDLARLIQPHARTARCAILRHHGAVSWDADLERARWWMEILEATCRTAILARSLGPPLLLSPQQLLDLRRKARLDEDVGR